MVIKWGLIAHWVPDKRIIYIHWVILAGYPRQTQPEKDSDNHLNEWAGVGIYDATVRTDSTNVWHTNLFHLIELNVLARMAIADWIGRETSCDRCGCVAHGSHTHFMWSKMIELNHVCVQCKHTDIFSGARARVFRWAPLWACSIRAFTPTSAKQYIYVISIQFVCAHTIWMQAFSHSLLCLSPPCTPLWRLVSGRPYFASRAEERCAQPNAITVIRWPSVSHPIDQRHHAPHTQTHVAITAPPKTHQTSNNQLAHAYSYTRVLSIRVWVYSTKRWEHASTRICIIMWFKSMFRRLHGTVPVHSDACVARQNNYSAGKKRKKNQQCVNRNQLYLHMACRFVCSVENRASHSVFLFLICWEWEKKSTIDFLFSQSGCW